MKKEKQLIKSTNAEVFLLYLPYCLVADLLCKLSLPTSKIQLITKTSVKMLNFIQMKVYKTGK